MSNIKNKSEINHLIGSIVQQPINKDLGHLLLAILCEDRKKLGVFIERTIPDLTKEVFREDGIDYKPLLDNEHKSRDLFIKWCKEEKLSVTPLSLQIKKPILPKGVSVTFNSSPGVINDSFFG